MAQLQEPYYSRVEDVIRVIEAEKIADTTIFFDMARWWSFGHYKGEQCGTAACIGGCAETLAINNGDFNNRFVSDGAVFGWLTGFERLPYSGTNGHANLFYPYVKSEKGKVLLDCDNVTKEQAIKVLRHLQATGEVDWNVALGRTPESA